MAATPTFPKDIESTGIAWKSRSGELVHKTRRISDPECANWFCTGCRKQGDEYRPDRYDHAAEGAKQHAAYCSAIKV